MDMRWQLTEGRRSPCSSVSFLSTLAEKRAVCCFRVIQTRDTHKAKITFWVKNKSFHNIDQTGLRWRKWHTGRSVGREWLHAPWRFNFHQLAKQQVWSNFVFSYLCVSVVPMSRVAHSPASALAHPVPYHASFTFIRYLTDFFHRSVVERRALPMNRFKERKNENYVFQLVCCCWWRSPTLHDRGNMF